ncbi:methylated-DNA--[protein]-cysteine S-methyltransferase [Candidatus Woesearchaeota archaeon]|nr:methylated-DNA--[protein]-cysteine S-methyltransferase [Candidatus Woesearchaeota archaeon]
MTKNFSEKVLELCRRVPRGRVTTYKDIASAMGSKAYRAVGNALHKNNKPVKIPCHRVIRSDGKVGGYAGGIRKKMRLLKNEGVEIKDERVKDFRSKHVKV